VLNELCLKTESNNEPSKTDKMNGPIHAVKNYDRCRSDEGDVYMTVAKSSEVEDDENDSSGKASLTTIDEAVTVSGSQGEVHVLGETSELVDKEQKQFASSGAQCFRRLLVYEPFGLASWIGGAFAARRLQVVGHVVHQPARCQGVCCVCTGAFAAVCVRLVQS